MYTMAERQRSLVSFFSKKSDTDKVGMSMTSSCHSRCNSGQPISKKAKVSASDLDAESEDNNEEDHGKRYSI